MKTEKQIRDKIKSLELRKEQNPKNVVLYTCWLDAMHWVLEEYCSGMDCAWCSDTECINM